MNTPKPPAREQQLGGKRELQVEAGSGSCSALDSGATPQSAESRPDKVRRLKAAVGAGTYRVEADSVADRLLRSGVLEKEVEPERRGDPTQDPVN